MANPGFYFYTGDFQKKTRVLTLQTKGAWIDMLCMMNDSKPRGVLTFTVEQWSRVLSVSPEITGAILLELETEGVANVSPSLKNVLFTTQRQEDDARVTVVCRRMEREGIASDLHRLRQKKYKKKEPGDAKVTHKVTPKCSASSSSSSLSSSLNLKDAAAPVVPVLSNSESVKAEPKSESRKLDPTIKVAADPIYQSNPEKFARLVVWIREKEKRDYPGEVITTTLRLFWQQEQKAKVADWWPYLNRIFTKEFGRWNEEQSSKHKAADNSFVLNLLNANVRKMGV